MSHALRSACFDSQIAEHIVLATLPPDEREAHMAHAEACDACLGRLSDATRGLVSHGPEDSSVAPARAPDAECPGGMFAQRYVILDTLGHGGMGVVYLAHDTVLGREVALKVVRQSRGRATEMLRGEARALAAIQHPNVVTVYDLVVDGARLAVAMERLRGTTLRVRMRQRPLSRGALLKALMRVSSGLGAAHAAGVVHGDVKLDNVLIDSKDRVRITDFGLSRLVGANPVMAGGTALYLAPEVEHEAASPSAASDQYSLAACWVDGLLGERPASSSGWRELTRRVHPRWTRRPLERALSRAPDERFDGVATLLRSLQRRRVMFSFGWLAIIAALVLGPWLTLRIQQRSTIESCVQVATMGLPEALSVPEPHSLVGELSTRAWMLWGRGVFAYAAWRTRWTGLQRRVCMAPEEAPETQPCLDVERRWLEVTLGSVVAKHGMKPHSIAAVAELELIEQARLCDDPNERATVVSYEASAYRRTAGGVDVTAALTLAKGSRASLRELDAVIDALGPGHPSRLLVGALLTRTRVRQHIQDLGGAQADAELAMELAARLHRRELQAAAATMLGSIAIQETADAAAGRFWSRFARALSAGSQMFINLRHTSELDANVGLVSGRSAEIVRAVDGLLDHPVGVFAVGPRLLTIRGMALVELGDLAAAAAALAESLAVRLDELLVDPSRIAGTLSNLATLAHAFEDEYGAYELLEDARRLRAYLPEDHPDRLTLERSRARFDAEVFGRPETLAEAERLLAKTRERFPERHPDVICALTLVADLALRFGMPGRSYEAAFESAQRVERYDLGGVMGALPFIVQSELGYEPRASFESALRRLGPILPGAPVCERVRRLARNLGTTAGGCDPRSGG